MPKIRYIQDAPAGNAGDEAEVNDIEANVLIATGFAELVSTKPATKATKGKDTAKKDD